MRLAVLERPVGLLQRVRFAILRAIMGQVPGPFLALSYKRKLAGKHLARCYQQGLREAREWPVGEIEIFAAFVSHLNQCRF
jgi:hypothetical protein